jgi:hypothetical protein
MSNGIIASTWSRNEARNLQCAWLTRDGSCRSLSDSAAQRCDFHWSFISVAQPGLRTVWYFVSAHSRESKARPQICSPALGPARSATSTTKSTNTMRCISSQYFPELWVVFRTGFSKAMWSTCKADAEYKYARCAVQAKPMWSTGGANCARTKISPLFCRRISESGPPRQYCAISGSSFAHIHMHLNSNVLVMTSPVTWIQAASVAWLAESTVCLVRGAVLPDCATPDFVDFAVPRATTKLSAHLQEPRLG